MINNLDERKKMLGMSNEGGSSYWKLNKITLNGKTGHYKFTNLLKERQKGEEVEVEDLGSEIAGVILKMRWSLSKYDGRAKSFYVTSEYDFKGSDKIQLFSGGEKVDEGIAQDIRTKHNLHTERVIYIYLPAKMEIVRVFVRATGLSADEKSPHKGLFQYMDEFAETEELPDEYITHFLSELRQGDLGEYHATVFKRGRKLTETEFKKTQTAMKLVNEKTMKKYEEKENDFDLPQNDDENLPSPDDIPF